VSSNTPTGAPWPCNINNHDPGEQAQHARPRDGSPHAQDGRRGAGEGAGEGEGDGDGEGEGGSASCAQFCTPRSAVRRPSGVVLDGGHSTTTTTTSTAPAPVRPPQTLCSFRERRHAAISCPHHHDGSSQVPRRHLLLIAVPLAAPRAIPTLLLSGPRRLTFLY
jgi:hypothetical protein